MRSGLSELPDQVAVRILVLVVIGCEGHSFENVAQVAIRNHLVVQVHVSDSGNSSECGFCAHQVFVREGVISLQELFANVNCLLEALELPIWQIGCKHTETIADSLNNEVFRLTVL